MAVALGLLVAPVLTRSEGRAGSTSRPAQSLEATRAACSNTSVLSKWSSARLAFLTLAVPVEESSVAGAAPEVKEGVGGLLLFGAKAPSSLGKQLGSLETDSPAHHGLLVMTDEEGGEIQRMSNLVGSLPWPAWMGAHWTPAQITAAVEKVARKMHSARVNTDLAPVLDVDGRNVPPGDSDPDGWRSFSGKTSVVDKDGVAYMDGLLAAGEIPVVKHFPGLGGASGNTDVEAAHTLPWSTLKKVALPPFLRALAAGAPAVMVSNATVPGLSTFPASLSPAVIAKELVQKLGFHGLIMTDSLSAVAISAAGFSLPAAAVQALRAGADMVLFGLGATPRATSQETSSIEKAILSALAQRTLSRSRLVAAGAAVLGVRHVKLCS